MFAWFNRISIQLNQPVDILPLVIFRVVFGLLMFFSMIRFMLKGWVSEFYIEPIYHFTYFGFDWIRPLPPTSMYAIFSVLTILSVMIAIGIFYRLSILSFFLLFTYVELIDKTYYLNHYYFVSVVSLLMITLPLHRKYSMDSYLFPRIRTDYVASWTLLSLRLMLTIVYVYAGIAKLTPDWMLNALPLRIWLPANAEVPIIGWLFDHLWVAYLMSWGGAFYDLTIPFFLLWRRTRPLAYLAVIIFHIMTALLFNIGVFPYVMIASTLIFFDGQDWRWLANKCRINLPPINSSPKRLSAHPLMLTFVALFFAWQLLMPLRHWLYPGNHLWTNEGYRFAWHVMLVEKNGTVSYRIEDPNSDDFWIVYPDAYLTPQQEHQMSFQADMILQFAHFLADKYQSECGCNPEVYADTYVSLNLRMGQALIDPTINLANTSISSIPSTWIVPLE